MSPVAELSPTGMTFGLRSVFARVYGWSRCFVANFRHMTGDDAYERYVAHHRQHHVGEAVLDRRAFYLAEQQRKWTGVKRCC